MLGKNLCIVLHLIRNRGFLKCSANFQRRWCSPPKFITDCTQSYKFVVSAAPRKWLHSCKCCRTGAATAHSRGESRPVQDHTQIIVISRHVLHLTFHIRNYALFFRIMIVHTATYIQRSRRLAFTAFDNFLLRFRLAQKAVENQRALGRRLYSG